MSRGRDASLCAAALRSSERRLRLVDGSHTACHGVDTINALVNVGLARGLFGRPNRGTDANPRALRRPRRRRGRLRARYRRGDARRDGRHSGDSLSPRGRDDGERDGRGRRARRHRRVLDRRRQLPRDAAGDAGVRDALSRPRLRIHQDIVVTSAMLVDPSDTVLLLPATTRYESPGGGTETSTERRIIFSPEIAGRRVGRRVRNGRCSARSIARVRPACAAAVRFETAEAIRDEIANAVPLYAGIERLRAAGDQVQWGGPRLFEDWQFNTPTGRAQAVARVAHGTGAPTWRIRGVHAPRQAIQLDGAT